MIQVVIILRKDYPGPEQSQEAGAERPEEWSEGYIFETVREKYILGDETRIVELPNVQGLGVPIHGRPAPMSAFEQFVRRTQ